jgi:hypothetical protein
MISTDDGPQPPATNQMSFEFPVEIPGAPPPPGPNIITVGPRPKKVPMCKECIKQRHMIEQLVHQIEHDNNKAKDIQEQQDDMIESYRFVHALEEYIYGVRAQQSGPAFARRGESPPGRLMNGFVDAASTARMVQHCDAWNDCSCTNGTFWISGWRESWLCLAAAMLPLGPARFLSERPDFARLAPPREHGPCPCADVSLLRRRKMEEAIRKMQDRLFNKGRKYNELIQVRLRSESACVCALSCCCCGCTGGKSSGREDTAVVR